ncbi:class I SAM-dependent methyltransferase [Granulicella sp. S156]|uniref:class I SAM-dependent methyltransferase n=1 Tax=Granulicella sp. S156 TaxID=1747224 RepID=UPI0020B164FE|nr:class I SAM-dependent methyltransferase [Granulicella sp. S156]
MESMQEAAKPSRTALGVAIRRASHQLYDSPPLVLEDPIAVRILGEDYRPALEEAAASIHERSSLGMRAWVVARNRYAEDKLAQAVNLGVRQYVLLGAGLDTFAHRNPHPDVRVFEVDHPATQHWKRELLGSSGLQESPNLHFVSVDFERQSLASQLENSGLDCKAPTVFAWLGVVLYLTYPAFRSTLDFIATFPEGSGFIMDYAFPREALPPDEVEARDALAARVQSIGEPFQLFFTKEEIATELTDFQTVEDLGATELNARYFAHRTDRLNLRGRSGRLLSAWR